MEHIDFIDINLDERVDHVEFLYELLKQRKFSISHKKLPSFSQHKKFVRNNPYALWKIIKIKDKLIGSVYLNQDNSIGLHILNEFKQEAIHVIKKIEKNFTPLNEVRSLRSGYFSFNISPNDSYMQKILELNNYEIKQISLQKKKI